MASLFLSRLCPYRLKSRGDSVVPGERIHNPQIHTNARIPGSITDFITRTTSILKVYYDATYTYRQRERLKMTDVSSVWNVVSELFLLLFELCPKCREEENGYLVERERLAINKVVTAPYISQQGIRTPAFNPPRAFPFFGTSYQILLMVFVF